jgi:serine/threonine-protein kinase
MAQSKMSINAYLFTTVKIALICLVVVIGIGLIGGLVILPKMVRTKNVVVPDLVGQNYEHAFHLLHDAGLQFHQDGIDQKPSASVPKGHVIAQSPLANSKVKLNKPVRITLSVGNQKLPVPDTTGETLKDAEAILKKAGFQKNRVAEVHSDRYPVNMVIAQTPAPGVIHQRGEGVNLLLSLGTPLTVLLMPDLHNMPIDEVRNRLKAHGLESNEEYKSHPEIPSGLIISHQPAAGELIQVGQSVTLEVSGSALGRADRGRFVQIRYTVSTKEGSPKRVRIFIDDEQERHTIINDVYQAGELIELSLVRVVGKATMVVYEDGTVIKREPL